MSNLKTFEKWVYKRQKPACLRIPHLTPASGDEYYYSLLVLFKLFQNESEIIQDVESPRDAFCTTNWCPRHAWTHPHSSIWSTKFRMLLSESDYKIPPLRWTLQHKYLQANASMLISAFSRDPHSLGESHNHVDESLSCNKYPELPCQIPTLSTYSSVNFRCTLNPPEWRDMWTASHLKFNFPIQ